MSRVVPTKQVVGTNVAIDSKRQVTRKGCPNHPIDLKRRLAAAACEPGVSVAKLAMEHGINVNLLFKWRRLFRAGHFGTVDSGLLPVKVTEALSVGTVGASPESSSLEAPRLTSDRPPATIEIRIGSAVVTVHGDVNAATLRTVVDCLVRLR